MNSNSINLSFINYYYLRSSILKIIIHTYPTTLIYNRTKFYIPSPISMSFRHKNFLLPISVIQNVAIFVKNLHPFPLLVVINTKTILARRFTFCTHCISRCWIVRRGGLFEGEGEGAHSCQQCTVSGQRINKKQRFSIKLIGTASQDLRCGFLAGTVQRMLFQCFSKTRVLDVHVEII